LGRISLGMLLAQNDQLISESMLVSITEYLANLDVDKKEKVMSRLLGLPRKYITGTNRDDLLMIFSLMNSKSILSTGSYITSVYVLNGTEYHVTEWHDGTGPEIEEIIV
jgi:hypothetical protein